MKPKPGYKLVKSLHGKYEEIPKEWKLKKLSDIVTESISYGVLVPDSDPDGIPMIRSGSLDVLGGIEKNIIKISKNLEEKFKKTRLSGGELLISLVGYTGQVTLVPDFCKGYNVSRALGVIRLKEEYHNRFYYYVLKSNSIQKKILNETIGSAQPVINLEKLRKLQIIHPTFKEQQKITHVLSHGDCMILSYERIIQTTKYLKTALMQRLLTRGIGHKKFKKVKSLFGKEIEIPEEWEIIELEQVSKIIDSLHITPEYSLNGIPMVRSIDIKHGDLKLEKALRVTKEIYKDFTKNHKPQRNDIVMSRVGTYFVTSFVNTDELFCMGQNTLVIHPKIDPSFLYYFLNSVFINRQIEFLFDRTGGQKTMSMKNINKLSIFLPPLQEQEQIGSILQKSHSKILVLENKKLYLEILKKGLMQKLLTGKIRVKV